MIIPLYNTTANKVASRLVEVRESGGANALGRVLTLLVVATQSEAEDAIKAANLASMEHPCRVIVLIPEDPSAQAALDAEIRVGGDAGASEVVVLRMRGELGKHEDTLVTPLLLPDAPIVAWWPDSVPANPSLEPLGAIAQSRVTDSHIASIPAETALDLLRSGYTPGDTDLAWARITLWRAQLAAALDEAGPGKVLSAKVSGLGTHTATDMLAAWIMLRLGCPVEIERLEEVEGLTRVELVRKNGSIILNRPDGTSTATLSIPGTLDRHIYLAMRQTNDCLSEELRRLDPDVVYGEVVEKGLGLLARGHAGESTGLGSRGKA